MHPTIESVEAGEHPTIPARWAYPLDEAAQLMGLSVWTLKNLADNNKIAIIQDGPGTKRTVEGTEIRRYLADHRIPANSEGEAEQ